MFAKSLKQLLCKHASKRVHYFLEYEQLTTKKPKPMKTICLDCDKSWSTIEKMEEIKL